MLDKNNETLRLISRLAASLVSFSRSRDGAAPEFAAQAGDVICAAIAKEMGVDYFDLSGDPTDYSPAEAELAKLQDFVGFSSSPAFQRFNYALERAKSLDKK